MFLCICCLLSVLVINPTLTKNIFSEIFGLGITKGDVLGKSQIILKTPKHKLDQDSQVKNKTNSGFKISIFLHNTLTYAQFITVYI